MRRSLVIVRSLPEERSFTKSLLLAVLLVIGTLMGQAQFLAGFQRLDNGNTVITDAGDQVAPIARVVEVDSSGQVVWAYLKSDITWAHTARRLANGNTLITGTNLNKVLEIDPVGDSVWAFSAGLDYPNEAIRLANGNTLITDRNNNWVIEVNPDGTQVWSYTNLLGPHNGNRLANGNTLICDSDRNRIVEVDSSGAIVWQYATGLSWPRCAQRLANGNTLICDSNHHRTIEIDPSGTIVWSFSIPGTPYMCSRLADSTTLVAGPQHVFQVNPAGSVIWEWPGWVPVLVDTLQVTNPESGCALSVHIHRPATASESSPRPAVVLVPDGVYPGTVYDTSHLADIIAADGFVVLHFDAEGRGGSSGYPEDYDGTVHQSALHACLNALAGQPCVDSTRIGILSEGYGVTMAAGMLARCADSSRTSFLIDFEGPANRYQSCMDSGGLVPVNPDSEAFWQDREAARDMSGIHCAYLRMQTAQDRNPGITDGRDCIALIDSATNGSATWTRVNDSVMNQSNRTYTIADPPVWIPENQQVHNVIRYLLYLREMVNAGAPTGLDAGPASLSPASGLAVFPNPASRMVAVRYSLARNATASVGIYDAAGRLVKGLAQGPASAGEHRLWWDGTDRAGRPASRGVYCCRLQSREFTAVQKLVRLD